MNQRFPLILLFCLASSGLSLGACNEDAASTELLSLSELEQACVISAACGIQVRARVSNCIDYYFDVLVDVGLGPVYSSIYRCVKKAGSDCRAVAACFGETGSCTKDTFTARCEGSKAYTCDLLDEKVYALQCGIAGLSCAPNSAELFAASCVCDASFSPRCHGSYAVACQNGQIETTYCVALGVTCVDGRCGVPANARTCSAQSFQARCEGSVAITCINGKEIHADCGQRLTNRRCDAGSCVRSGSACTDEFNRCQPNGDLEACIDGTWRTYGCASMGLGDCRPAFYGANCARFN